MLKIVEHSYLDAKNTGTQLFRAGVQLFSAKNTGAKLISANNTGAQLFRAKQYRDTAI